MSFRNGDRSRSHRVRKQKIARRIRDRAMMKSLGLNKRVAGGSSAKPKATVA